MEDCPGVSAALERIETRIGEVNDRVQVIGDRVGDLRERVARVETRSGLIATMISGLGAVVGVLIGRNS